MRRLTFFSANLQVTFLKYNFQIFVSDSWNLGLHNDLTGIFAEIDIGHPMVSRAQKFTGDPNCQVAKKVIEFAQAGDCDSLRLKELALKAFEEHRIRSWRLLWRGQLP